MFNLRTYFPHHWASNNPVNLCTLLRLSVNCLEFQPKQSLKNRKRSGKSQGKVGEFHCHGSVGTLVFALLSIDTINCSTSIMYGMYWGVCLYLLCCQLIQLTVQHLLCMVMYWGISYNKRCPVVAMGNEECMCHLYMNDGPKLHLLCRKINDYRNNML